MSSGCYNRQHMKVAIQGQVGSFHDLVARKWYGDDCQLVECRSFSDVFEAYKSGEAQAIITAVENTVYGSINEVYQLIASCAVPIIGEVRMPVQQHLIGAAGSQLADIKTIYSHPVALAQSHGNLRRLCPGAELVEFADTAAAVEHVKRLNQPSAAAVGSRLASQLHGLAIIEPNVHDNDANLTRFLVLEKSAVSPKANRSSLLIRTNHQPGALVDVLSVFSKRAINLVKVQSQPIVGQPWQYNFFIVADCAGQLLADCSAQITAAGHKVQILGQYQASE